MGLVAAEKVYLSLGSNLGERLSHLQKAVDSLSHLDGVSRIRVSPVYETSPWGECDQPAFLNCAVELYSQLEPEALLQDIQAIESSEGRERAGERYPARTLDIDILVYGERTINTSYLVIPHPLLSERRFVLKPWSDLAPDVVVPGLGQTVASLLNNCRDTGMVEPSLQGIRL